MAAPKPCTPREVLVGCIRIALARAEDAARHGHDSSAAQWVDVARRLGAQLTLDDQARAEAER